MGFNPAVCIGNIYLDTKAVQVSKQYWVEVLKMKLFCEKQNAKCLVNKAFFEKTI